MSGWVEWAGRDEAFWRTKKKQKMEEKSGRRRAPGQNVSGCTRGWDAAAGRSVEASRRLEQLQPSGHASTAPPDSEQFRK